MPLLYAPFKVYTSFERGAISFMILSYSIDLKSVFEVYFKSFKIHSHIYSEHFSLFHYLNKVLLFPP